MAKRKSTNGLKHFMVEILGRVCGCGSLVLALAD
jgi:hypothetical protein